MADFESLRDWLRNEANELLKQAKGRRDMQANGQNATQADLDAGHRLAEKMMGRKLPRTSVEKSKQDAAVQGRIADKLEAEASQLSVWADSLPK